MSDDVTLWDLVSEERIPIEAVTGAVDTYLVKPTTSAYPIGLGYVLDLASAVAKHTSAAVTLIDAEADETSRRIAVRAALLMAKPKPA